MIQRHIPTPPGRFAKCPSCGHQPRHIEIRGRTRRENLDWSIAAVRHSLECRCGRTTASHETLRAAEVEWGLLESQIPLAMPPAVTPIHHGRRLRPKGVR